MSITAEPGLSVAAEVDALRNGGLRRAVVAATIVAIIEWLS